MTAAPLIAIALLIYIVSIYVTYLIGQFIGTRKALRDVNATEDEKIMHEERLHSGSV